jgi:3-oxoacyl-[acyl-carrier protein] reductase
MQVKSRVALISGSTHGIGMAIVQRFVNDGWTVVQNSRNSISKSELIGAKHFIADVTNFKECKSLVDSVIGELGQIDALICNTGSGVDIGDEFSKMQRWDHFLRINLNSASNLISAALNSLKESKGSVTAISSICGIATIEGAPIEYSASKAALNTYIKSLAIKHGPDGVRFNVVAPGNVLFDGSTWDSKLKNNRAAILAYISENVPMNGFVDPKEVAAAVAFLASQESKSTTGAVLTIDRGQSL